MIRLGLTILAGVLFGIVVIASDDLLTPAGKLDPLSAFLIGDARAHMGMLLMLGLPILLMMIMAMLYRHRSIMFAVALLGCLVFYFITADLSFYWIKSVLALLFDFEIRSPVPQPSEIVLRIKRFGLLGALSMVGLIPAVLLGGIIDRSSGRRFRRLLTKRRKQRRTHD